MRDESESGNTLNNLKQNEKLLKHKENLKRFKHYLHKNRKTKC
jgi:hypothetical protein